MAEAGAAQAPGTQGQIAARAARQAVSAMAMAESHTNTELQHAICQARVIAHGTASAVAERHTEHGAPRCLAEQRAKQAPPCRRAAAARRGPRGAGVGVEPLQWSPTSHVTTWRAHALGPWGSCYRAALRPVGCCGRAEGRPGSSQGHSIELSQVKTPYPGTRRWASRR
jgi:hypothetical protein